MGEIGEIQQTLIGFNYGTELPDPAGLLEGTGKKFRHLSRSVKRYDNDHWCECDDIEEKIFCDPDCFAFHDVAFQFE